MGNFLIADIRGGWGSAQGAPCAPPNVSKSNMTLTGVRGARGASQGAPGKATGASKSNMTFTGAHGARGAAQGAPRKVTGRIWTRHEHRQSWEKNTDKEGNENGQITDKQRACRQAPPSHRQRWRAPHRLGLKPPPLRLGMLPLLGMRPRFVCAPEGCALEGSPSPQHRPTWNTPPAPCHRPHGRTSPMNEQAPSRPANKPPPTPSDPLPSAPLRSARLRFGSFNFAPSEPYTAHFSPSPPLRFAPLRFRFEDVEGLGSWRGSFGLMAWKLRLDDVEGLGS